MGWFLLWPAYVLTRFVIAPLTALDSRRNEYAADCSAAALGYDGGLYSALDELKEFEGGRTGWEAAMTASHPPAELRLEHLEEHLNAADRADSHPVIPSDADRAGVARSRRILQTVGFVVLVAVGLSLALTPGGRDVLWPWGSDDGSRPATSTASRGFSPPAPYGGSSSGSTPVGPSPVIAWAGDVEDLLATVGPQIRSHVAVIAGDLGRHDPDAARSELQRLGTLTDNTLRHLSTNFAPKPADHVAALLLLTFEQLDTTETDLATWADDEAGDFPTQRDAGVAWADAAETDRSSAAFIKAFNELIFESGTPALARDTSIPLIRPLLS